LFWVVALWNWNQYFCSGLVESGKSHGGGMF
jgi:hypothetical protein